MFCRSCVVLCPRTVIGFTGTIASGKTARCHRLVQRAVNAQLPPAAALSTSAAVDSVSAVRSSAAPSSSAASAADAAALVEALPVRVRYINADLVGHSIYLPGTPCYTELVEHFGPVILAAPAPQPATATAASLPPPIDRRALGAIVFGAPQQLEALNGICWPHIREAIRHHIDNAGDGAGSRAPARHVLVVVEAALLLEMRGTLELCSDVWLTHCSPATAVARVQRRDGLSHAEAERRVASQSTVEQKLALLAERGYTEGAGTLTAFGTDAVTLEEGLAAVDAAFGAFWNRRIAPHLQ